MQYSNSLQITLSTVIQRDRIFFFKDGLSTKLAKHTKKCLYTMRVNMN